MQMNRSKSSGMYPKYVILLIALTQVVQSFGQSAATSGHSAIAPYSPSNRPRMAAEWENAIGVLIAWPLSIPKELVVELARDTKLYLLVEDQKSEQEAIQWLTKWKVTPDRVKFVPAPQGQDVAWTRDWGPYAVFTPDGSMKLADAKYLYATPVTGLACDDPLEFRYLRYDDHRQLMLTKTDDQIPDYIASSLGFDIVKLPFAFTGGNVISDGQRSGFSTCILTNENRYTGIPDEEFIGLVNRLLGMDRYHVISNFEERGIQHIDCFMKLLDEERILVMRPPTDHPAYARYERIVVQELSRLTNAYGRPYQILRLNTDRYSGDKLAAYTNSLILNQTVYVPLFGISQDAVALKQWAQAMPGYRIKGFEFPLKNASYFRAQVKRIYKHIGWTSGDALHCRTRAIWDPNMIYMSVDRIPANTMKAEKYTVNVIIKDYSRGNLIAESLNVRWRVKGETTWKTTPLKSTGYPDRFSTALPGNMAGATVEYYAEAKSTWGTQAAMPRTAPNGFYNFKVN